jgi:hypothetical protein
MAAPTLLAAAPAGALSGYTINAGCRFRDTSIGPKPAEFWLGSAATIDSPASVANPGDQYSVFLNFHGTPIGITAGGGTDRPGGPKSFIDNLEVTYTVTNARIRSVRLLGGTIPTASVTTDGNQITLKTGSTEIRPYVDELPSVVVYLEGATHVRGAAMQIRGPASNELQHWDGIRYHAHTYDGRLWYDRYGFCLDRGVPADGRVLATVKDGV